MARVMMGSDRVAHWWEDDTWEGHTRPILALGAIFVALVLLVVLVIAGVNQLVRVGCRNTADAMGLQWRYGFSTGCLVLDDGRWIDIDNVGNMRVDNG